jgi:hypothetical protein
MFQKELYNGITNITVWQVLGKRLHLKAYKLSIVEGVKVIGFFSQPIPSSRTMPWGLLSL